MPGLDIRAILDFGGGDLGPRSCWEIGYAWWGIRLCCGDFSVGELKVSCVLSRDAV